MGDHLEPLTATSAPPTIVSAHRTVEALELPHASERARLPAWLGVLPAFMEGHVEAVDVPAREPLHARRARHMAHQLHEPEQSADQPRREEPVAPGLG